MRRIPFHFLISWLLLAGCGYYTNVTVQITNFSPKQPIAVKLPTQRWFVIYPGDIKSPFGDIPPEENTLLIAFTDSDDPAAFARAADEYGYSNEDVNPPRTKIKHFTFDARKKVSIFGSDEPVIKIVAEEIDTDGLQKSGISVSSSLQGIATIRFRVAN